MTPPSIRKSAEGRLGEKAREREKEVREEGEREVEKVKEECERLREEIKRIKEVCNDTSHFEDQNNFHSATHYTN